MIHKKNVDHTGIPNAQLVNKENAEIAAKFYENKEQHIYL
jgi:hypothetical protein